MHSDTVRRAALNNACWCDAVCRAHGKTGAFTPAAWSSTAAMPRYYPNLVTLDVPIGDAGPLEQVRALMEAGLPDGWAIKDSFACLDLDRLGFTTLFAADWIHRPPTQPLSGTVIPGVSWRRIDTPADLKRWESAWTAAPDSGMPSIFLPPLLAEPGLSFIAGERDGEIVAGCVAGKAAGVIGISNLFAPPAALDAHRRACIDAVARLAPGIALVSYDDAEACRSMAEIGFERVGPLRVLQSPARRPLTTPG